MIDRSSAQKFVENVDYLPELNYKSVTVVNLTDTVKILYVTDSTMVAFTGHEVYDSATVKYHLKCYKLDHITAFYQRQKGKIVAKTLFWGMTLGLTGGLLGASVSGNGTWSEVEGFESGFIVGSAVGVGVGLITGFANFQKYDWRKEDAIGFKKKKIKKYQACGYILPYHLKLATTNLVAQ